MNSLDLSIPVDIALRPSHQHLADLDAIQEAREQIARLHASGEFILYFQPQICLKAKKISGLEVLIRHRSHDGKITPPIFLQYYERLGLMIELDFWVIAKSIEHIHQHMPELEDDMMLSINVSPQTLLDPRLAKVMAETLSVPLPARWTLEFEITESAQLVDHAHVSRVLADLSQRRIKVALDDFGSGYSTLSYLTRYSLDKIKLDRTLVQGLQANNGIEFFNQVVSLCKIGQAQVLVEGVETREELSHVFSAGVDAVQGYFFYRPLPLDDVTRLLRESKEDDRITSLCASV